MIMEKTLFKNLRLMDSRIGTRKSIHQNGASVKVRCLYEAEELMRTLVARNDYEDVTMSWDWNVDLGYSYVVTVWWKEV